jgi:hypothetical protein
MTIHDSPSRGNGSLCHRSQRPRRYWADPSLSAIVDRLQVVEDRLLADGDLANARLARTARSSVVAIAMGGSR